MNSSAPVMTPPPDAVVSITTSSVNTCAHLIPLLGVHGAEVPGLELLDRLDVVHVTPLPVR